MMNDNTDTWTTWVTYDIESYSGEGFDKDGIQWMSYKDRLMKVLGENYQEILNEWRLQSEKDQMWDILCRQ